MSDSVPILKVDLAASTPVYRQIVSAMRTLLVSGQLSPGDILPSVRELALDLGVHHNTVAEAYRMLAEEGWLELRRRRGAMVLYRPSPEPSTDARADFERRLVELVAEAKAGGVDERDLQTVLKSVAGGLTAGHNVAEA
jgi:DNA-binding transcriptional regulator YhcF (GntR family)